MINIEKLFDLMADKGFQDPNTGNLFFPAYIYTYPAEKESEFREQIVLLIEKLNRPNLFLDCLSINIYHELIQYFKLTEFSGKSIFDLILEKEKEDSEEAFEWVREELENFFIYLENKVGIHFKDNKNNKRVYLLIHGFGTIFPYLRASELLKNTEKLIKDFKLIIFYPGKYENTHYSLFGILNDDNMYRVNYLNKIWGIK